MAQTPQALILFAHGARDPRWAEPMERIRQILRQRTDPAVQIHLAFLELMSPSLPQLVATLAAEQIRQITIVPIFLGQGGHVRRDLPALVRELESGYGEIEFHLTGAIGESELVLEAIAGVCADYLENPGNKF